TLERHQAGQSPSLVDIPDPAVSAVVAALTSKIDGPVLVVTTRRERADQLTDALAEYLEADTHVVEWAAPDALPYEQLPVDTDAGVRRVKILADLASPDARLVLVTSVYGLMELLT